MAKTFELVITCAVTFITLGLAHFFCTWRMSLGRRVKPPWTYVVGVLMLVMPWSSLMWAWGYNLWEVVGSLAAIIVSGGVAVGGGYLLLDRILMKDENLKLRAHLDRTVGGEGSDGEGICPES